MESEQSENFNERLSQWVANQGFWFQVRYSMTGSGTKGTAVFHLLRLSFRLLVFLLVMTAGISIYLIKRTEYQAFSLGLKESLRSGLSASEIQLGGFSRVQGRLEISRFACEGGTGTFFTSLEARNIRAKMGFLDGVVGQWDPGNIAISKLDVELRAGADDEESAMMFAKALFKQSDEILINSLEVGDASLRWGYSESTRGAIENSLMNIQRTGTGLKLSFKGGRFSQNWLRRLEIVNLVAICEPYGIVFEKAEFRRGQSTVDFSGLKVIAGARPTVNGMMKVRMLGLESALPVAMRTFVEGSFSGDFQVSGSTNSSDGIGFAGQVTLDGQDTIALRERFHLLKALSVVDYVRNYHRVDFREGSFLMKTSGGGMELTEVKLKAADLLTLEGQVRVRLPTQEEAKQALGKTVGETSAPLFQAEDEQNESLAAKEGEDSITLRRAAQVLKREREGKATAGTGSLFDRLGLSFEMRRLEEEAADRSAKTLRFQGNFLITLLPDSFERAPRLAQDFPVDGRLGRIPMMVPIEGTLYELTLKQAEDIYQQGTR
jgi:hypothetical protein